MWVALLRFCEYEIMGQTSDKQRILGLCVPIFIGLIRVEDCVKFKLPNVYESYIVIGTERVDVILNVF